MREDGKAKKKNSQEIATKAQLEHIQARCTDDNAV
jgi:hypothetical protein